MPKGLTTHAAMILCSTPPNEQELERVLAPFQPQRRETGATWEFGETVWMIPYRPEVNGHFTVDLVSRPWPDEMGDPENETMLFGAWTMGHFGPFTFPGGLDRAALHCYHWDEGEAKAQEHGCFLRLRSGFAHGGPDDPVMPEDYDPTDEATQLTGLAVELMKLPQALAFFNPSGEVLSPLDQMEGVIAHYRAKGMPPLDLWSNIRMFDVGDGWLVMDTVGMAQLDLMDLEVAFHEEDADPTQIANFLRNAGLYLANNGPVVKDGDSMEGPLGTMVAYALEDGLVTPPRPVFRFVADPPNRPMLEALAID